MNGLDGWNEASDFVRQEDVDRWNANTQITPKTFPTLLNMSIHGYTVRSMLFNDNLMLIGTAEGLSNNAPPPKPPTKADEPEDEEMERYREAAR